MDVTVFADVHFGKTQKEQTVLHTVSRIRSEGRKIVWLGDTYDILCISDAVKKFSHHIHQDDEFVTGNHDWGIVDKREIVLGDIFLTHGDLVDFGYAFGRLQQIQQGLIKGTLLERFLCRFRRWSLRDTFTFYNLKYELTDQEVNDFHNGNKLKHLRAYWKIFQKLIKSPINEPYPIAEPLPHPLLSERYLGYMTTNPESILRRILTLYPASNDCSVIVIGHLHHSIDRSVTVEGRTYRLICLNSWIQKESPQILNISTDDGTIQIVDIE